MVNQCVFIHIYSQLLFVCSSNFSDHFIQFAKAETSLDSINEFEKHQRISFTINEIHMIDFQ
jgi:hypothetical protein